MNKSFTECKRGSWPDIAFGIFLVIVSAVALHQTRNLNMGTTMDMGPSFMPRVLASVLGVAGVIYIIRNVRKPYAGIEPIRTRSLILVCSSFAAFALLLDVFGLVVSTVVLTVLAMLAGDEIRNKKELIIYPIALTVFTVLAFVVGLRLPISIWPSFL